MPTARPRHQVTETPEVEYAIDRASIRWPGESRSRLLLRLIAAGAETIAGETRADEHAVIVRGTSGKYTAIYPPHYLDDLRADWDR